MKAAVKTNFRGMRALVVLGNDSNRFVLASVLGKLGLDVQLLDPHDAGVPTALQRCDVVLLDADINLESLSEPDALPDVPCIALIGTETPSQLARVVRQGCISHILKPVRSSGVFTALLLAVNEHEKRQKIAREMAVLRQRLAGRREVTAAVLTLMVADGIDQDAAYERLRVEAMNRRMPIEELAREYLARDTRAQGGGRRPRIKADDTAKKQSTNRRLRQ